MTVPANQHEAIFTARMNVIYHERLESFYGQIISWTNFLSLMMSGAAFITLGNLLPGYLEAHKVAITALLALLVAALNGAILAFGMQQKLALHSQLKLRWSDLLGRTQITPDVEQPKNFANLLVDMAALNAIEPAPKPRRLKAAYDTTVKAMGL